MRDASHRETHHRKDPEVARGSGERTTNARTPLGKQRRYREVASDPETLRRRKSTANRLLTILRAALNKAFADGKVASDHAWRRVKPFRDVDSARVRYLTDDECRRLVNACDADFRPLVQAALLTGCRYGELVALRTADFNADVATLRVPQSKGGKARNVVLTHEGYAFFARALPRLQRHAARCRGQHLSQHRAG